MTQATCIRRNLSLWTSDCPCTDCTTAYWRVHKAYNAGNYKRSTPEEAMVVLDKLIARRWSNRAIATATGIKPTTASSIVARRRKGLFLRLGPLTCKALIEHGTPTDGSIGTVGARRRLQALSYLGYTLADQSAALNICFTTLHAIVTGRTSQVKVTTDNAVRDLYRRWRMTPGPSVSATRTAIRNGYCSQFAWDDESIDDPAALPVGIRPEPSESELRIQARIGGDRTVRLQRGEAAVVARRLLAEGWSKKRIYLATGVEPNRYKNEVA